MRRSSLKSPISFFSHQFIYSHSSFGAKIGVLAAKGRSPSPGANEGAANAVSKEDTQCVICQFIVQRVRGEMLMSGLNGGVPLGVSPALVGLPQGPANMGLQQAAGQQQAPPPPPQQQQAPPNAAPSSTFLEVRTQPESSSFGTASLLQDKEELHASKGFFGNSRGISRTTKGRLAHLKISRDVWKLRRERNLDMLNWRPQQVRYQNLYDGPLRAQKRAQERFENNQMYATVYETVEDICTKRMPKPFYGFCGRLLSQYQKIAQGIRWRDRPDAVCMAMKMCTRQSYIRRGPHATFRDY